MKNKKLLLFLFPFLLVACDTNELLIEGQLVFDITKTEVQSFLDMNSIKNTNKRGESQQKNLTKNRVSRLCNSSLAIVSNQEGEVLSYSSLDINATSCNPIDMVTPNFNLIINPSIWQIDPAISAPYESYDHSSNSIIIGSVGHMLEHVFRGLRNQGIPPPLAPGMSVEWIETNGFEIFFTNFSADNITYTASDLEQMRDGIACSILETYFNGYNTISSSGHLQTMGKITVMPSWGLCSGNRIITTRVSIGYIKYSQSDQDYDEALF